MTKHELVQHTGQNYAQVWLQMAMHYFDPDEPGLAFEIANRFIEELAKRQFPARTDEP